MGECNSVFVKFTCTYLHQIVPEIMQLLVNNLSKNITGSQDRQNFDTSQAIFVICTHDYNFALVFHKKCTIFHPIRSTYFFHVHNYACKECLQLGHQISNIAPPLYNNSLQVNDPYNKRKLKFSYMLPGYKNLPLL